MGLRMLVRHLSYFVTLAREQHFARAAEACCVAQPTLSAAIRTLEEHLDIELVLRGRRFIGLTLEGEKVLEWARQILADYDGLKADLSVLRDGLAGHLRLGVVPAAMPSVHHLTSRFCAAHPAVMVEVRSLASVAIQRGLDIFEIDAGLTYLDNEPLDRVRRVPLYRERYTFFTRRQARFENRTSITWADAFEERLCLLSDDMQNRRIIDRVAAEQGLRVRPCVVSNSFLGVCAHVRDGGWSAIVPHTFAPLFDSPDLLFLDLLEPTHSQAIGIVFSNRDPSSPMATALLQVAKEIQTLSPAGATHKSATCDCF